jgi:hypothetical protein
MIRTALIAILIAAAPAAASAQSRLQSACAAWDLHFVSLIESIGIVEPASIRLAAAAEFVTQARVACRAGNATALQLYDAIDLSPPARGTLPVFGLF